MKKTFLKDKFGYTLTELMIVISIIGIFSSMTVINFRGNAKQRDLDNRALLVVDGIKRMQTSALSGRLVNNQVPVAYRFTINQCSQDCVYTLGGDIGNEVIPIQSAVSLTDATVDIVDDSGNSIGNNLIISLLPPRGTIEMTIDGNSIVSDEAVIKLTHRTDQSIVKKIKINGVSGRIDISND